MARAYSNDLRRKFLQAYDKGKGTLEELAEQFEVSVGWAKKISAYRTRTGQVERAAWRHGPKSRVTEAEQQWLQQQIRQQPDLTLVELQKRMEQVRHLRLSIGRLWTVLQKLGLPLKKSHSTPKNKTAKKPNGDGRRGRSR